MLNWLKTLPLGLVHKPIEQVLILLWLVAFAQYMNSNIVQSISSNMAIGSLLTMSLTAILLMISAYVIALRSQNIIPLFFLYWVGLCVSLMAFDPLFLTQLNINNGLYFHSALLQDLLQELLFVIGFYSVLLWLLVALFLKSRYFQKVKTYVLIIEENHSSNVHKLGHKTFFILAFLVINISLLLSIALSYSMNYVNGTNYQLILLAMAMGLLFLDDNRLTATLRGILLPIYSLTCFALIILPYVSLIPVSSVLLSVILWIYHNFLSLGINNRFPSKAMNSNSWPWYGLLVLMLVFIASIVNEQPNSMMLLSIIVYAFLMLRNTSTMLIRALFVIAIIAYFIAFVFFIPQLHYSFNLIAQYCLYTLLLMLGLMTANYIWRQSLTQYFESWGWPPIYFDFPVKIMSFILYTPWLMVQLTIAVLLCVQLIILPYDIFWILLSSLCLTISAILLMLYFKHKVITHLVMLSVMNSSVFLWSIVDRQTLFLLFALLSSVFLGVLSLAKQYQKITQKLSMILIIVPYWALLSVFISTLLLTETMFSLSPHKTEIIPLLINNSILLFGSYQAIKLFGKDIFRIALMLLVVSLTLLLRIYFVGMIAMNPWDTIAVLSLSMIFYALSYYQPLANLLSLRSLSLSSMTLLLPMSLLLTLPMDHLFYQDSMNANELDKMIHIGLSLLALGVFYAMIQKISSTMKFVGYALINLAIYQWVPYLSTNSGLLLFYTLPVMLSLLLLTFLHKNEVKKGVLNSIRMAILSVLYTTIAADIFLNDAIMIFLLGLVSALLSIAYGIASKTRVFLYMGMAFLILIIMGQLMTFYPDGRLARALILMFIGALITIMMIWFNIKREQLLAKMQLIRSDLASWN